MRRRRRRVPPKAGAHRDDHDHAIRSHDRPSPSAAEVSRRSAGVRIIPHSQPKMLPSCRHADIGASSTILSPHSSHTSTTCPEVPSTSSPLLHLVGHGRPGRPKRWTTRQLLRATALGNVARSVPVGGASRQGQVASTCTSARAPHRAEARVHLYLDLSLRWAPMNQRCLLLGRRHVSLDCWSKLEDAL